MQFVTEAISKPLVVFSKSYCPYCTKVKGLFQQLKVQPVVYELDQMAQGSEVQAALAQLTGQRTVPNVFINGKSIGGCSDTFALYEKDQLLPLLQAAKL